MFLPFAEMANCRFFGGASIKHLTLTSVSPNHLSQMWHVFGRKLMWTHLNSSDAHLKFTDCLGAQMAAIFDVYSSKALGYFRPRVQLPGFPLLQLQEGSTNCGPTWHAGHPLADQFASQESKSDLKQKARNSNFISVVLWIFTDINLFWCCSRFATESNAQQLAGVM